jgi:hypothetical protein
MENKMKLEKFDLEKALNGAKVVTRDGREVTQLTKFEGLKDYPLVGIVDSQLHTWTTQGPLSLHLGECGADLFLAVEPKRIWVNVFKGKYGNLYVGGTQYNSPTRAKLMAENSTNMQYIKTIEITDEL